MKYKEAIDNFKNFIMENYSTKPSANGWYQINGSAFCNRCRSSSRKKDPLYILLDYDSKPALNCFRAGCDNSGVITLDMFKKFRYENDEAIEAILKSRLQRKFYQRSILDQSDIRAEIHYNKAQHDYILARTKVDYLKEDLNMVTNLEQFYNINNLGSHTDVIKYYKEDKYVIFLTKKKTKLSIRSISGSFKNVKSLINDDTIKTDVTDYYQINSKDMYCDNGNVETIFIGEGVFDVINIRQYNQHLPNAIYVATLGITNTLEVVKELAYRHILTLKRVVFVLDSVSDDGEHYYLKKEPKIFQAIKYLVDNEVPFISSIYNAADKDFGDMREKQVDVKQIINYDLRANRSRINY